MIRSEHLLHQGCCCLPSTSRSLVYLTATPPSYIATRHTSSYNLKSLELSSGSIYCNARRRIRQQQDDDEPEEEYGHNPDIALLESYTESARNEALLVRALVDEQHVEILIFKGFSSCLSYSTSPDPSTSILPERAVITSIDRVIGPFDPSNIEYIEKDLAWDAFKNRLQP